MSVSLMTSDTDGAATALAQAAMHALRDEYELQREKMGKLQRDLTEATTQRDEAIADSAAGHAIYVLARDEANTLRARVAALEGANERLREALTCAAITLEVATSPSQAWDNEALCSYLKENARQARAALAGGGVE